MGYKYHIKFLKGIKKNIYLIIFSIPYFITGIFHLEFFKWSLPAKEFKALPHVAVVTESKKGKVHSSQLTLKM